jgi:hypothetical protein
MARFVGLIFGVGLAAVATAACASNPPQEVIDRMLKVCKSDLQRVCPSALPGDKRVGRCLLDHERELAAPCLKEVRFAYTLEACTSDVRQFCANAPQGRTLECLSKMAGSLSADCRRAMTDGSPRTAQQDAPYPGNRYGYDAPPQPYAPPGEERYGYRQPPSPRTDPYGYNPQPRPYAAPSDENYGYDAPQGQRDRRYGYDAPYGPYARPYDGQSPQAYAYRGPREDEERGDGERYGDEGARRDGDGDGRYADREPERPRFQPYGPQPFFGDGRYADRGYYNDAPGTDDGYDGRGAR